ncbi:MAG: shikimate dehydrogenase [Actinomycetota bacterium]|nr:shikimate dehydrogenase [Actinomycetota bacterium]MDZ4180369.1 shikimate dehydrogenase [Coriobacteriia bacterium]
MRVPINGRTRLAGVIGMPLGHTLSPAMHNAVYEHVGLDWVYIPLAVEDEADLRRVLPAIRALPFVGFNVTMPFKQAMLELCDEVAMLAQMAGAVNTVHCIDGHLVGYNTDGRGLTDSLAEETGFSPEGANIAILGAGGAAGAAGIGFILGKASRVTIANRSVERAEELAGRLRPHARATEIVAVGLVEAEDAVREAQLVVNATPLGMEADDPSPVHSAWLRPEHIVCDMIYRASDTSLLQSARSIGATAVSGLGMLVHQGALAIDIWNESTQSRVPRDVMRAAAEHAMRTSHVSEVPE